MTKERSDPRAQQIVLDLRGLPDVERRARLDVACGDDDALRREVENLLSADGAADETVTIAPHRPEAARREDVGERESSLEQVGPYRVLHKIGSGGMGLVFLATRTDGQFHRRVALKILKRGMDTADILRRFEKERQFLAALNHPGIARLYDGGETEDGRPYLTMEYVEGLPIDRYCDANRLTIPERLQLFRKVCAAVHHAHQNLVVHRDLKPGNILVGKDGEPKLLDFGIAKVINPELVFAADDPTAPDVRVMTPAYASPEQVRGEPINTASDVYALGVILYELVCGRRPYHFRTRVHGELVRVISEEEPTAPSTAITRVDTHAPDDGTATLTPESVSRTRGGHPDRLRKSLAGDIDNIVLMALRKEPHRRYASAEQFSADIDRHVAGMPVIARRDTLGYRSMKFIRRNRAGVAAAAVMAMLLTGGVVGTSLGWSKAAAAATAEAEQRVVAERAQAEEKVQRERAERRFQQVRALARTFMFDFHDLIQTLDGSLPARELLVQTALDYLDGLAGEVGDDPALRRELASAYDRVGDLHGGIRNPSLGDTASALALYEKALALRTELSKAAPDDDELRAELATSHLKIADMQTFLGDKQEALASYRRALDMRAAVVDADPENISARRAHAGALQSVGDALLRLGDRADAIDHFERSLTARRELAAERPEEPRYQRSLASGCIRVAHALCTDGAVEEGSGLYEEAIRIRTRLVESNADNARWRRDLAVARYFYGVALVEDGQPDAAIEQLDPSLAVMRQLARENPTSARATCDLTWTLEAIAGARAALDDPVGAERDQTEALETIGTLAAAHPDNVLYGETVARLHEHRARSRAALDNLDDALDEAETAVAQFRAIARVDELSAQARQNVARAMTLLAQLLLETDRKGDALRHIDEALGIYRREQSERADAATVREGLATVLHERSRLMEQLGDARAAAEHAEEALGLTRSTELRRALEEDLRRFRER